MGWNGCFVVYFDGGNKMVTNKSVRLTPDEIWIFAEGWNK